MLLLSIIVWCVCVFVASAVTTCEQGTNCMLPKCFCANIGIPSKIHPKEVPQMVVIATEGNMDNQRDKHYEKLFPKFQKNPNGCPSSATFFIPEKNTDVSYVKKWYDRGMEIALNSIKGTPDWNFWTTISRKEMKKQVLRPWDTYTRKTKIPKGEIRGYRNPAFFAAGNVQYQVLEYEGFQYDASLRVRRRTIYETDIWPSTLNFPWGYRCDMGMCPTNSYDGFWVVPSFILFNGTESDNHGTNLYTYSTAFPAKSKEEMFDFLWNNFIAFYESSRAPFILNINTVGFLGEKGDERLKGYEEFFIKAQQKEGVFFVSMHQLIEWMKSPTPLKHINKFLPWSCPENNPDYHNSKKKGVPINLNQLGRKSKSNFLFSRNDNSGLQYSFTVMVLSLIGVTHLLKQ